LVDTSIKNKINATKFNKKYFDFGFLNLGLDCGVGPLVQSVMMKGKEHGWRE